MGRRVCGRAARGASAFGLALAKRTWRARAHALLARLRSRALSRAHAHALSNSRAHQVLAIVFVVAVAAHLQGRARPLMSPGDGCAAALAEHVSRVATAPTPLDRKLQSSLAAIASYAKRPRLSALVTGVVVSGDVVAARRTAWHAGADCERTRARVCVRARVF